MLKDTLSAERSPLKRIALIVALTMALCLLSFGLPTEYSTRATSGAPTPAYPISPEYLNLQAPFDHCAG